MAARRPGLADVRRLATRLPGVAEGTSYGTPAFRVGRRLFARMLEDGASVVVKVDPDARDALLRVDPEAFQVTPHYEPYPMVIVRLAKVGRERLGDVIEQAWRREAPARLAAAYDAERGT